MALTQVTSAGVKDGELVNADFSSSAAIATSKISGSLTSIGSHGLAASATTDTTNASNLSSGTVAAARLDTATTQSAGNNSTKIATTAYADTAISNLVDSSPSALNTLNELAAALGDDANFSTTVTNSIAAKLPLAGGTLTGNVTVADDIQIRFGSGADLQVYHSGGHSWINNVNASQNLIIESQATTGIRGSVVHLTNVDGSHTLFEATAGGSIDLYHNNSKKFETTNTGISVTGKVEISDDLDLTGASYNALWDKSANTLKFNDSAKVTLGTGADVTFYHDGSNTFLNSGTGYLLINNTASTSTILRGASDVFMQTAGGEQGVIARANGPVELYDNNVKKFATTSTGVKVTGIVHVDDSDKLVCGTGQDLHIYHDGSVNIIDAAIGNLEIRHGAEKMIACANDGQVELYYDGSRKIYTSASGVVIQNDAYFQNDASVIYMGADNDGRIFHSGSNFHIRNTTGNLYLEAKADENSIRCDADGPVRLYYDNVQKFETTSGGANIHGALSTTGHISPTANNTYDLGDSTYRWRNLYINDLQLSNEGSSNSVDGTWGDWTLQEGEQDIFMINNRSGKKYKMALQEVS